MRDIEGAYLIRDDVDAGIVFGQKLLEAARTRHDSANVWIDTKDCDRSLAVQYCRDPLRSDTASHLLIVQDVKKPFAGGNRERRADDDCGNAARDGSANRSDQCERMIGGENQSLIVSRSDTF